MKRLLLILLMLDALGFCSGQTSTSAKTGTGGLFHNDRLKLNSLGNEPIFGNSMIRIAEGAWVPDSPDPGKALVFPEQVKILCENNGPADRKCTAILVVLGPTPISVTIQEIDDEEYAIDRWDDQGLIASYGGDRSSKCQRHVLTMDFASGAVSLADIPTHVKGCEAFTTTDSYHLVHGEYYVDTTTNNDADKPYARKK